MNTLLDSSCCQLCPRNCRVNRKTALGFCKSGPALKAARAALHHWEEPCLSGSQGSGTVFFCGCTLQCCYCQNYAISSLSQGKEITSERLGEIFLSLQDQGAHNINLVTPTHFLPWILPALDQVKHKLRIPVVYNCGGYEKTEIIALLKDYVDIWLPDLKYCSSRLSGRYSKAPDYFSVASQAILAMTGQTGKLVFDEQGLMKKGVIIRHLVLPGCKEDSFQLLSWLRNSLNPETFLISLLSQYTPCYKSKDHPSLNRRITTYEYGKVVDYALELGLTSGFMQEKSSAKEEYTPPFNLEGL